MFSKKCSRLLQRLTWMMILEKTYWRWLAVYNTRKSVVFILEIEYDICHEKAAKRQASDKEY